MKYSLIALCLFTLPVQAQYIDDPYAGDRFYEQPNLNTAPGATIQDNRGNRWYYQPNINTAPGGTIQRRRAYRSLRDRDYRDNDPSYGNVYRQ